MCRVLSEWSADGHADCQALARPPSARTHRCPGARGTAWHMAKGRAQAPYQKSALPFRKLQTHNVPALNKGCDGVEHRVQGSLRQHKTRGASVTVCSMSFA